MIKLSMEKKLLIIRLYFDGLSYAEIASKAGASTGTVANTVAELKAGQLPGIEDINDQLDVLRELAVGLKEAQMTPVQAAVGLYVLNHLNQVGVEPKEIAQVATLCHDVAEEKGDPKSVMHAALTLEDVKKQTGMGPVELEEKVKGLKEAADQLEPVANEVQAKKKELAETESKIKVLDGKVSAMEHQQEKINKEIAVKVQHNEALAAQTVDLQGKAHAANVELANAREDLKTLAKIGLSAEALAELTHEIKGVAIHHNISPAALSKFLYEELMKLEKGLGLDADIKAKQAELMKTENALIESKKEQAAIKAANNQLMVEQSGLEAAAEEIKKHIIDNLGSIDTSTQEAMATLKDGLAVGMQASFEQVGSLKDKALELGEEMGKIANLISSTEWLSTLDALVKGKDTATPSQIRVISLIVMKAISAWFDSKYKDDVKITMVKTSVGQATWELEHWIP